MRTPSKKEVNLALNSFSKIERLLFFGLLMIFIISALAVFNIINQKYMVQVPALGGSLTEGVIGEAPRFINPLLATSDADRDLTALVYSGLLRVGPNGGYIGDLAENYTISPDGLTYTFKIRDNAFWQDGKPVTSDDVEFTIKEARDPAIKSYKRPSFEGVTVDKPDSKTVVLRLKQPYAPFLENATIGILPKHIWSNIDAESFPYSKYNMSPIGSGPYQIQDISSAVPPAYYNLKSFANFTLGQPKIQNIIIRFYPNEDALLAAYRSGEVEAINTVPPLTAKALEGQGISITRSPLPRIFAMFFNQNHSKVLADKSVRKALETVVNRSAIVKNILLGYGQPIYGPTGTESSTTLEATSTDPIADATQILKKGGWKFNTKKNDWEKTAKKTTMVLALDISTADTPELKAAASEIQADWQKLGVQVNLKVYEIGDLNQNVIRPRKYDALFFGEVIGRNPDLFSFWHSSQRNDPGLNISMYTNSKADKYLEAARVEEDPIKQATDYANLDQEIENDTPAIFVYSPDFLYAVPAKLQDFSISSITIPSDRFTNIYKWYIDTDRIWKIFAK